MTNQTARYCELVTQLPNQNVALRGVHIHARIAALAARVEVRQTFINLEDVAIEAVYTFPLPDGAAVCGFEVITGDRVLSGAIDEIDQARERYDQAVEQGDGAFLLDSHRPDVFSVRVGNLKPRQAATIKLQYVIALQKVDRQIRLSLPTTIAPRYASTRGMDAVDAALAADDLNPPHALEVPYGLTLRVDVDLRGRTVRSIESPTHTVHVETLQDATQRVSLSAGISEMNRDLVLGIELAKEHGPSVERVRGENDREHFLAVTFAPEFDFDALAEGAVAETVFVLDCSGSMQGASIEQATRALELCLRSMNLGDRFNVVRFGSRFEMLSSEPLVYAQKTLDRALAWIGRGADLGGTELMAPLQAIFATTPEKAGRNVVLLTDGQVTNEPAVVELARHHRGANRLFTFGIGSACSAFLVNGLARATGGASEFISGEEKIEDKVLRLFSRLASPPVSDVELDFDGTEVERAATIPPIFDGDLVQIFARVAGTTAPRTITLRGRQRDREVIWSVPVPTIERIDPDGVIPTMWARHMIRAIEDRSSTLGAGRPAELAAQDRKRLIELSKQFNLLTSLTSFVAIEHRSPAERNDGRPELRRVPVMIAKDWHGLESAAMAVPSVAAPRGAMCQMDMNVAMPEMVMASPAKPAAGRRQRSSGVMDAVKALIGSSAKKRAGASAPAPAPAQASSDTHHGIEVFEERSESLETSSATGILLLQSADGTFAWNDDADRAMAAFLPGWAGVRARAAAQVPAGLVDTLVALVALKAAFASEEPLWRRAAKKGIEAIAKQAQVNAREVRVWIDQLAMPAR